MDTERSTNDVFSIVGLSIVATGHRHSARPPLIFTVNLNRNASALFISVSHNYGQLFVIWHTQFNVLTLHVFVVTELLK